MERKYTSEAYVRLKDKLKTLQHKAITESIVFNKEDEQLYIRLHNFRQHQKVAKVMRELIDLGLKQKGC